MKRKFEKFLIEQGYSLTTPSGNPSTVYDYQKRIDKVCKWEDCTWEELARNIDTIVKLYDEGGAKENLGKLSHTAVISALKQFMKFVQQ